jgi:hypothetical protein
MASPSPALIADGLNTLPEVAEIQVQISNELIHLLSDQLYQSPLKAIEELVVNAFDADADTCKLFVPPAGKPGDDRFMAIFDTGSGMTTAAMTDLWHIGRSTKRDPASTNHVRKQIGKFGIGKLATYTVSNRLTYFSKTSEGILSASLDFGDFKADPTGSTSTPVKIKIRKVANIAAVSAMAGMAGVLTSAGIVTADLNRPTWTLALIENLKEKANQIRLGRLHWVLSSAMPMSAGFRLFLNGSEVTSTKDAFKDATRFTLAELPDSRLKALNDATDDGFFKEGDAIKSKTLTEGVTGLVRVTEKTLPGKSDDLLRSFGFFVRVRGRLINEEEPFFGMTHLHHGTLNRFRADLEADDLDVAITAPRESIGLSQVKDRFEALLREIFQEARQRYEKHLADIAKKEANKKEPDRTFVSPELLETPIADALSRGWSGAGADADSSWFYVSDPATQDVRAEITKLYEQPRTAFTFTYVGTGPQGRFVKYDPVTRIFALNSLHPFVVAQIDNPRTKNLLEDIAIAEVMLETQLRLAGVAAQVVGEVLEERNKLLIGLALEHPSSRGATARMLRDSSADEHDLELALVAAARSLGFVAKHISGSGEADGVARFVSYPEKITKITLEAKSSSATPSLGAIDFAGLQEHMIKGAGQGAQGCLLISPSYPACLDDGSATATRAKSLRISCWTIDQLADVVVAAESRHITARDVLDIVLSAFAPLDVSAAIKKLFDNPLWDQQQLNDAIIEALRRLEAKLPDMPRTLDLVAGNISMDDQFPGITASDVKKAAGDLASMSKGALKFDGTAFTLLTSYDELRRRTIASVGEGLPLRSGQLKSPPRGAPKPDEH